MTRLPASTEDLFAPEEADEASAAPAPARFTLWAVVAVDQPIADPFTYGVPETLLTQVCVGRLVMVPFGRRPVRGCILELLTELPEEIPASKVRPITEILSPEYAVDSSLLELARWMTEYYMCGLGEAVSCVSFLGLNDIAQKSVTKYRLAPPPPQATTPASSLPPAPAEVDASSDTSPNAAPDTADQTPDKQKAPRRLTDRQQAVLAALAAGTALTSDQLRLSTGASADTIRRLVERGLLVPEAETVFRGDEYGQPEAPDSPLLLAPAQLLAYQRVRLALLARDPQTFLLHGVTGSGKTEVYLQAADLALELGGSVIILVPEIALTPQTVGRFRRRFGERVGVYHSKLTLGQKFDLWRHVKSGECRVMIGARSAVFTPFADLRLIVVDEEHEGTYKQDTAPRYSARDMAILRARRERAVVVLGSATPSIETYYKAQTGKFELLHLSDRVDHRPMPAIDIVDMTQQAKEGDSTSLFSPPLKQAIDQALERKEQVLLFLNRRGFFNFRICLQCHKPVSCKHCDFALTYHKPRNILMCHYCSREYRLLPACDECNATDLSLIGIGTQRVEESLQQEFPSARIIRVDLDTTRRRNAFLEAWRRIEQGEVDIILGTQMIAKGIHLERVTVVGVPLADVSLYQPDFRSAERAFSVLTQVAGRAGRGESPGKVYIQTYAPHHYAIEFARTHDYRGFYDKEIRVRQVLRFPPFFRLISVLLQGLDERVTEEMMKEFASTLRRAAFQTNEAVTVLGPAPAPIARIKDHWRWRLLIRGADPTLLRQTLQTAIAAFRTLPGYSRVQIHVDVDPMDLL